MIHAKNTKKKLVISLYLTFVYNESKTLRLIYGYT